MTKFNSKTKTKAFFPIKQYRFNTDKSPVLNSKKRCAAKVGTVLSMPEQRMLEGLTNIFQCIDRDAFRIACHEAVGLEYLPEKYIEKATTDITRNYKLDIKIPTEERDLLKQIAKEHKISDKQMVRAIIIWFAKEIRNDNITRIDGGYRIGQDKLAREWSKQRDPKAPSKLKALHTARKEALNKAIDEAEKHRQAQYERRGEMMDRLRWEGVRTTDTSGDKVDLTIIDAHIAMENEQEFDDLLLSIKDLPEDQKLDAMVSYQMGIYPDLEEAELEEISKAMLEPVDWETIVTEVPSTPTFSLRWHSPTYAEERTTALLADIDIDQLTATYIKNNEEGHKKLEELKLKNAEKYCND